MLQNAGVLHILTCKCASRHSGVPFLNIGTSKSGPRVWCFAHFDLQMHFSPQRRTIFATSKLPELVRDCGVLYILNWQMRFAPQRRAIFEHQNIQNWLRAMRCFEHFALANALRATAACHFWTSATSKIGSEHAVFCTFWLENVLRATAACHFSSVC